MSPVDLRVTYGWHLCGHARQQVRERGVSVRQILYVVADPELSYTAENYGPGRWVYKRGEIAVVVAPSSRTVITVLWNTESPWTSAQFRAHLNGPRFTE